MLFVYWQSTGHAIELSAMGAIEAVCWWASDSHVQTCSDVSFALCMLRCCGPSKLLQSKQSHVLRLRVSYAFYGIQIHPTMAYYYVQVIKLMTHHVWFIYQVRSELQLMWASERKQQNNVNRRLLMWWLIANECPRHWQVHEYRHSQFIPPH